MNRYASNVILQLIFLEKILKCHLMFEALTLCQQLARVNSFSGTRWLETSNLRN